MEANKHIRRWIIAAIVIFVACTAFIFFLFLSGRGTYSSISPSHLSLRQHHGLIQWKPTNAEDTDDNWHTITTVSALTGKDGKDGKDGQDGTDGQNGANGTDGTDGRDGAAGQNGQDGNNGANGTNGKDGQPGTPGPQGEQGLQGNQGQSGANGNDGQDGTDGRDGADGRDGIDGRNGQDGTNGTNGVDGTNGLNGREIELQKDLYFIQWRYVGEPGWRNLIAYSDLKGDKGDTGATGPANTLSIGTVDRTACNPTATITGTAPSQTLNLGIPGLPTGGTAGQVLTKNSNTDCDTSWQNTGELKGNGMPNGTVTAPVGTYYTDTAGTNGAWRWLKTTGAGNTGWTVIYGDTGERRYSTPYLLNGYTQYLTFPHISPHVTRVGDIVYWSGSFASIQEGLVNGGEILDVPLGFRPAVGVVNGTVRGIGGGDTVITSITVNSGKLRFTHPGSVTANLTYGMIQFSYVTNDPWPVKLPGEAV